MRATAAAAVLCLLATPAHGYLSEKYVSSNAELLWTSFKQQYGKKYGSAAEHDRRFNVFKANMLQAARMSAEQGAGGAEFGMNAFSDETAEEFGVRLGYRGEPRRTEKVERRLADVAVDSVDWRDHGAVTHVKDQARCGSCWTFSATGNMEGRWFLAKENNSLVPLSEQQIISCDDGEHGCRGGWPYQAFGWIVSSEGGKAITEAAYPYASGSGRAPGCRETRDMAVGGHFTGRRRIAEDENEMKAEVAQNGPLSIAVDASRWQSYRGGILRNCCTGASCRLDHAVLIVGFSTAGAERYWIIKNSWGGHWGEQGYIRVPFGENACGLKEKATTVVV